MTHDIGNHTHRCIITLNGEQVLNLGPRPVTDEKGQNATLSFRYDLTRPDQREIIQSTALYADCPLFHQIQACLPKAAGDPADSLRETLIFIDFSMLFKGQYDFRLKKDTPAARLLRQKDQVPLRLRALFEPGNGLALSFDGKNFKTFVPFDKSSSMARSCRISFIDSAIKEPLEKRLLLDIDFSKIKVTPSKYYAYRGLYLSSAARIPQDETFQLDQETVIVIPDDDGNLVSKAAVFSCANGGNGADARREFSQTTADICLDSFDGEGLIDPAFAHAISEKWRQLGKARRPSHSFQIRMPFTKGMLHEVDYRRFLTAYAPAPLIIKDVFGIPRDLKKAKIILTKSMFKCTNWLQDWQKCNGIEDPMAYFFQKMHEYDHTLYIIGTDAQFSSRGHVPLNSQFLSTLALTGDDFAALKDGHFRLMKDILASYMAGTPEESDAPDASYAEENDSAAMINPTHDVREKCRQALKKNQDFIRDQRVWELLMEIRHTFETDSFHGRLMAEGEQRYLSRDLAAMLIFLLARLENFSLPEETRRALTKKCLYSESFYMPKKKIPLHPEKYYGFLRNPHLSRNEQCLLRPFVSEGDLYAKYFSHLTGVVMVSYKSLVPMALAGADFDGDIVKIIAHEKIVDAIKNTVYRLNGDRYERRLAMVQIPASQGDKIFTPKSLPFDLLVDTFANNVGQISNIAIKFATKEYAPGENDESYQGCCAACTIVTGMEIDAAKTGVHPAANIRALAEQAKNIESVFLTVKKDIGDRIKYFPPAVRPGKKQTMELLASKRRKTVISKAPVYAPEDNIVAVERLPGSYMEHIFENKTDAYFPKNKPKEPEKPIFFAFETAPAWERSLAEEKKARLRRLIEAYNAICRIANALDKKRQQLAASRLIGHIKFILQLQYDSLTGLLPSGLSIEAALVLAAKDLADILKGSAGAAAALERLKEQHWHLTPKDRRAEQLHQILGASCQNPTLELLTNFDNNGYMLLYYLLHDIKIGFEEDTLLEDYEAEISQEDSDSPAKKSSANEYYDRLLAVYREAFYEKEEKGQWHLRLINDCRDALQALFDHDLDIALKYAAAVPLTIRCKFFWNVFMIDEILRNVLDRRPPHVR